MIIKHEFISDNIVVVNNFYFRGYYLYSFVPAFADVLIPNTSYFLSGESYHGQILIVSDYNLLTYLLLRYL